MSEKIKSCKLIVLWMLGDRAKKPELPLMTTKEILDSFTVFEKRKRILQALDELCLSNEIIKVKLYNDNNEYWRLREISNQYDGEDDDEEPDVAPERIEIDPTDLD